VSWRGWTRVGVAALGLGCAAALVIYRRDRPEVTPPPELKPVDPASLSEGQRGQTTVLGKDGTVRAILTFEANRVYEDGSLRYERAHLRVLHGEPFDIKAGVVVTQGQRVRGQVPDEFQMSEGVYGTTASGLFVESNTATYRDGAGLLSMPGLVTFGRGRLSGRGLGAAYRREANTLELLAEASVSIAPDAAGSGRLTAKAATMVLSRGEHTLHLDGGTTIDLDAESLGAAKASVLLTDDDQSVKSVRLIGDASVTPAAGATSHAPAMRAAAIDLGLDPEGRVVRRATLAGRGVVGLGAEVLRAPWIDIELAADGSTVTRVNARDGTRVELAAAPDAGARTIDARTLASTGSAKAGLTSARFDGDVVFVEAPAAGNAGGVPLRATSQALVLALTGGLGAIDSAEFLRNVRLTDGAVSTESGQAVYAARQDRLVLRAGEPNARRRPSVEDARVRVAADAIEINLATHDMKAAGGVETRSQPDRAMGKGRAEPGLFDRTREVLGSAPEMEYLSGPGRATYRGTAKELARVWQDTNLVTAEEIVLDDATENLQARRQVETTLEMAGGGADQKKPVVYRIRSNDAMFDQASRRAVFKGQPVMFNSPEEEVEGQTFEFRLASETRTIASFVFAGDVLARLPGGREGLGDRLTYDAASAIYVLSGKGAPALFRSAGEPGTGCVLFRGLTIELDERRNTFRSSSAGPLAGNESVTCDLPLRSIRR